MKKANEIESHPPTKLESRLYVALVGMPASGKTEATYILHETYGFESFRLSTIVRDEVHARGLAETFANIEKVARDLRSQLGDSAIIVKAADRLKSMNARYCCIDGIRSLSEVSSLKEFFPSLVVLGVHASPQLRFKRSRKVSPDFTVEEFNWRDQQNLALGLGEVIAMADFVVVHNDNSRSKFKRDLCRLIKRICIHTNHEQPVATSR